MAKRTGLGLVAIAAIYFLILWAASNCLLGIHLNREIQPVELASLLASMWILYIAASLQDKFAKSTSEERLEKEVFIDYIKEAISLLKSARQLFFDFADKREVSEEDHRAITINIKRLSNSIEMFESTVKSSDYVIPDNVFESLIQKYSSYKRAVTDLTIGKPISIRRKNSEARAYKELHGELHGIIFRINRCSTAR